jgi:hypothetical protein
VLSHDIDIEGNVIQCTETSRFTHDKVQDVDISLVEGARRAVIVNELPEGVLNHRGPVVEVLLPRQVSNLTASADKAIAEIEKARRNGELLSRVT